MMLVSKEDGNKVLELHARCPTDFVFCSGLIAPAPPLRMRVLNGEPWERNSWEGNGLIVKMRFHVSLFLI